MNYCLSVNGICASCKTHLIKLDAVLVTLNTFIWVKQKLSLLARMQINGNNGAVQFSCLNMH